MGGSAAVISGTPAAGTGGQYTLDLTATAPGADGPGSQQLTLNVNEAPIFTGPCPYPGRTPPACTVEVAPGATFAVTTIGYPLTSLQPLPASSGPLPQGTWMSFYLLHLPAGFEAGNRDAGGFATGTLTIKAPPDAPIGQEWPVAIFADNGVQPQAEQDLFIKIVKPSTVGPTTPPTILCTGCYFVNNGTRATLDFNVSEPGSGSTFAFNTRNSTQALQFMSSTVSQISPISGGTVTFSGEGTLNGQRGYTFTVHATDGGGAGSGLDTVAIQILGPNSFNYNTQAIIAGGDVVVHP